RGVRRPDRAAHPRARGEEPAGAGGPRAPDGAPDRALAGMEPLALRPIGRVRTPFAESRQIPKGLGAWHDAEGVIELRPDLEPGLTDVEGFSHLFVLWVFDRA